MSIGWVIFAIFIFLVCMGMAALTAISMCKDESEDDDTPEEDKDE